ncbi:MAG TPA: TonB family protein [Pyrinomonadaceae bacterium]|nr:TonB family protein [Pyrinomonadaceae bacterium]
MPHSRHIVRLAATLLLAVNLFPPAAARRTQDSLVSDTTVGIDFFKHGQYDTAVRVLRDAVKKNSADADAWYYLGLALSRQNKIDDAREAFERAVKLRPESPPERAALAYALLLVGKHRDAEREARQVLTLDARSAEAHHIVGVVRLREGRLADALASADEALKVSPSFRAAALLRSEALLGVYAAAYPVVLRKHPLAPESGKEERDRVVAARDAELEPLKVRLREAAEGLEKIVAAQPGDEDAKLWREMLENARCYSGAPLTADQLRPVTTQEASTKAVLFERPEPGYTEEAQNACVNGVVRLRMVLTADGRVTCILPTKTLGYGLTEKAVRAARRIKFTPAQKDGRAVSQWLTVEYAFHCG